MGSILKVSFSVQFFIYTTLSGLVFSAIALFIQPSMSALPGWVYLVFIAIGTALAATLILKKLLTEPLKLVRHEIEKTRLDGDLTRQIVVPQHSILAPLAGSYNALISSFHGIITRVVFSSSQVADVAGQLIRDAEDTSSSSAQQHASSESAADSIADIARDLAQVAEQGEHAAEMTRSAKLQSEKGAMIVGEASSEISRIAEAVQHSAEVMQALGERSDSISPSPFAKSQIKPIYWP
jgi:methyl-accepting chemotaxis protein